MRSAARSAATSTPSAARDRYTFSLAEARNLVFDSRLNSSSFKWWLSGPRGDVVSARNFSESDSADFGASPVLALPAGDYTLTVDADRDATGTYGFRLVDLGSAADVTAITFGADVTGTLDPGSETHFFSFDGTAREQVRLDLLSESRNSAYWRLIGPDGRVIFGPTATDDRVTPLPVTGRYVLLLEGRASEGTAVDYAFRVERAAQANPGAYTSQDFDADGLPYSLATFSNVAPAVMSAAAFPTVLSANTTGAADSNFVGAPDDAYVGLGNRAVTYDLGDLRVTDGAGGDFNVYEVDSGGAEFQLLRVEVSADGLSFVDVTASAAAKVEVGGDDVHGNAGFARSFSPWPAPAWPRRGISA